MFGSYILFAASIIILYPFSAYSLWIFILVRRLLLVLWQITENSRVLSHEYREILKAIIFLPQLSLLVYRLG